MWIGSGIGGMETFETAHTQLVERGPRRVSPFFVPMLIPDMATGQVSIDLGAKGPSGSTVTACATGTNSIGEAFKIIQRGDADAMITGGTEAPISHIAIAGFSASRALSTNNDKETACRPFQEGRDGFVMGEGAGIVVVESLESAKHVVPKFMLKLLVTVQQAMLIILLHQHQKVKVVLEQCKLH